MNKQTLESIAKIFDLLNKKDKQTKDKNKIGLPIYVIHYI